MSAFPVLAESCYSRGKNRASHLAPLSQNVNGMLKIFLMLAAGLMSSLALAQTAWERYIEIPSPENADLVDRMEYSPDALSPRDTYRFEHVLLLETQISSGDPAAFRLAYRLRGNAASAALFEDLNKALSRMIRPHPKVFLAEIQKLGTSSESLFDALLTTGEEYVDLPEARSYELRMRLEAIRSVEDDRLRGTRDICIAILEDAV